MSGSGLGMGPSFGVWGLFQGLVSGHVRRGAENHLQEIKSQKTITVMGQKQPTHQFIYIAENIM